MIERISIRNLLSFQKVDITLQAGLIAFSGPSGAGKSVLMNALLSVFGFTESQAGSVEVCYDGDLDLEKFGLEADNPNIFKLSKEKSTRYFLNMQSISKKNMITIASKFINYLAVKNDEEFGNESLISLLDKFASLNDPQHHQNLISFDKDYLAYEKVSTQLQEIQDKEKKIEDLKEFARFEIEKIDALNPKIGEDEELMAFKKALSKKEKIAEAISAAEQIFNTESAVHEFLILSEKSGAFFDECMNDLRALLEEEKDRLSDLDEMDVESLLERIEQISTLKSRFGSIEETLEHREKRFQELQEYENISFEKDQLQKRKKELFEFIDAKALEISKRRAEKLLQLNEKINDYLCLLYMPQVAVKIQKTKLYEFGYDTLHVELNNINVKKISSGEYNRLRLAFIATASEFLHASGGVLVLDEIDANLSGKESMSVAKVLKDLSKKYQIFAISHQPQLSSMADDHFIVTKDNDTVSSVKRLAKDERILELARMVSGEIISDEALGFAKSLFEDSVEG